MTVAKMDPHRGTGLVPDRLQFSQGSLQDFLDCQRLFKLRYLDRLAWPALESEPALENERHMQCGAAFHRLVQQLLTGMPAERLTEMIQDPQVLGWWQAFLVFWKEHCPPGAALSAEVALAGVVEGRRLAARYDALAIPSSGANQGRMLIFDWKTNHRRTARAFLAARMQTRVYPFLVVQAGAHLNGGVNWPPQQVEMIYWFTAEPDKPERFLYSQEQAEKDGRMLADLIKLICQMPGEAYAMTEDTQRCRFCVYRSLCNRGQEAGQSDAGDDGNVDLGEVSPAGLDVRLDFDSIAEVEF